MKVKNTKNIRNTAKKSRNISIDYTQFTISGSMFDKLDIRILQEMIKNSSINSSEISAKIGIPLSTIQRRRKRLENSTILEKKLQINAKKIGLRTADLLIKVSKGEIDIVADEIVNEHSNSVLEISSRVGQLDTNMVVRIVYKDSDELLRIMNKISRIEFIESIQWTEIVNIILQNEMGFIENMLRLSDY